MRQMVRMINDVNDWTVPEGWIATTIAAAGDSEQSDRVYILLRERYEEPDPADGWCVGRTKEGRRCLMDAARDGLCKRHWRDAHTNAPAADVASV